MIDAAGDDEYVDDDEYDALYDAYADVDVAELVAAIVEHRLRRQLGGGVIDAIDRALYRAVDTALGIDRDHAHDCECDECMPEGECTCARDFEGACPKHEQERP